MDQIRVISALDAESAVIDRRIRIGGNPDDPAILDVQIEITAGAAKRAGRPHPFQLPIHGHPSAEC